MRQSNFYREVIIEALWLWGTLLVGIGLATGITLLLYALGVEERPALIIGIAAIILFFVLSEMFYRVGLVPRRFMQTVRPNLGRMFKPINLKEERHEGAPVKARPTLAHRLLLSAGTCTIIFISVLLTLSLFYRFVSNPLRLIEVVLELFK